MAFPKIEENMLSKRDKIEDNKTSKSKGQTVKIGGSNTLLTIDLNPGVLLIFFLH